MLTYNHSIFSFGEQQFEIILDFGGPGACIIHIYIYIFFGGCHKVLSLFLLDSVVSPLRAAHRVGTSQSAPGLWQCDARQREEENNKIKSNKKQKQQHREEDCPQGGCSEGI